MVAAREAANPADLAVLDPIIVSPVCVDGGRLSPAAGGAEDRPSGVLP